MKAANTYAEFGTVDVICSFGDDVDHTGKRIGTIQRRARSADHFDARHVFQRHAAPDLTAITLEYIGDWDAVDQHQDLRIFAGMDATETVNWLRGNIRLGNMQSRHAFQRLVQIGRPHRLDILGGDHRCHGRCVGDGLLAAGSNADGILSP